MEVEPRFTQTTKNQCTIRLAVRESAEEERRADLQPDSRRVA
jgi:hypothetical protein